MKLIFLVVDDNPINLVLACAVLEHEGHTVLRAADGASALEVIQETTPDMILMDIQMPGMDGLTLTRQLKADPKYRYIPIVALSAHAMMGDAEKGLEAGCDGYITKPFETRILNAQLLEIYQRSKSKATTETPQP